MSFLGEIKRRKVFQVTAVYLVVSWLIMQVVDVVNEPLNLPDWFDTAVIVALGIGLPIALILAWAFDVTPEGVVRDQGRATAAPASGRRIEYVLIGLVVVALTWVIYRVEFDSADVAGVQREGVLPNSVAVLPFENLSPDPDNKYFAAGIHDTILNELAKIRDVNVIARTSVLRYADGQTPIAQIAKDLKVETVMEGSVQYAANQVRITAQLIDPATGAHLWSENYDRPFNDIFVIQTDIATKIALALEANLSPAEQASIAAPPTDSTDAYALYLQARQRLPGFSPGMPSEKRNDFHQLLDRAIEIDSEFALAYAAKANDIAFRMISPNRLSDPLSTVDREALARGYAEKALNLDPNLGLAYAALGLIHRFNWRADEALASYERALELNPNDAQIFDDYVRLDYYIGNYDHANQLIDRLRSLNPGDYTQFSHLKTNLGLWSGEFGRVPVVIAQAISYSHSMALVEAIRGNHAEAERWLRFAESDERSVTGLGEIAYGYSRIGRPDEAQRIFERINALAAEYRIGRGNWAMAYLAIGDEQRALEFLNAAADNRSADSGWRNELMIAQNVLSDPVLEQPEFVAVRERLGFRK